jgi:hypothetical protein
MGPILDAKVVYPTRFFIQSQIITRKLHEHIQVKFSKCDMELVGTDLIMCIKLLLLRLNVYEVYI